MKQEVVMGQAVALVALNWTRDKDPRLPLGHASLLAALAAANIPARGICLGVNEPGFSCARAVDEILSAAGRDGDVAIGVYVWGEAAVQRILPMLRAAGHQGRIILGGPQISYAEPGVAALYPEADVFIRGYAEDALVAVLRDPTAKVSGVVRRGEQDRGTQAQVKLSSLPSPWLEGVLPVDGLQLVRMETQRGCMFQCSFCQHREPGSALRERSFSDSRAGQELALFASAGVSKIAILDPIFNAGSRAAALLRLLRAHGYRGRISLQCRFELLNTEFLDACTGLDVQLEFGLQTIHHTEGRAVQRTNNLARVEAGIHQLHARQLHFEVSLIFGLPTQTLSSFRESVAFCLGHRVPVIKAFPLMLLRGTELERSRARWGLQESGGEMPHVIASDSFSASDWREMARISDALRATEGRHPRLLCALPRLRGRPALHRWRPQEVT